jgi:hypothetical protein
LFENYGQPNHIYYLYHGFTLEDNTHDCVSFEIAFNNKEWQALKSHGMSEYLEVSYRVTIAFARMGGRNHGYVNCTAIGHQRAPSQVRNMYGCPDQSTSLECRRFVGKCDFGHC